MTRSVEVGARSHAVYRFPSAEGKGKGKGKGRRRTGAGSRSGSKSGPYGHGDLEASFVLIAPLLFAYELGVLFAGRVNGADIVTRLLYTLAGSRTVYLLLHVILAVLFLLWIRRANRWGTLRLEIAAPVILEAAIYAMTLGALLTLIVDRLLGLGITGNEMVAALGAGVHEELVFRLGLFAGLASIFTRAGNDRRVAIPLALLVSSVLFAAAHHVGAHGEPFTAHAMVFRTLAGCAFGAIFWWRSFAHAVYAHVLYDLVVAAAS